MPAFTSGAEVVGSSPTRGITKIKEHNKYMKLTGADIYTENTITDEIKDFPSLKQACLYISKLPYSEQEITLLCIGNRNLDYIKRNETVEEYYQRMRDMVAQI